MLPIRKTPRANWDNYQNGTYFITICTHNRYHYFGEINSECMNLSPLGKQLEQIILDTPVLRKDQFIEIPIYTIMPNHIHFIMVLNTYFDFSQHQLRNQSKNLSSIIGGIKSTLTSFAIKNQISFAWQKRFYDRIIRNEREFSNIYDYIENNVINWQLDELLISPNI